MTEVVLTHLLNAVPDPQRRTRLPADPDLLRVLRESVERHGRHLVVLTDCLTAGSDHLGVGRGWTTFERVPAVARNPYWYRWGLSADWLAAHPEVDRAWCVDGTDVEMLHDPFGSMAPGVLYVGSEPYPIAGPARPWLHQYGPSVRGWLDAHPHDPVLNLGLVGGDATTVAEVCRGLADREASGDTYEMPTFQELIGTRWPDRVTGEPVHTVFRANDRTHPTAWWRHK